ncbi:MAG: hypothetical protein QXI16_06530 [Sulfolobaceae archaeon]
MINEKYNNLIERIEEIAKLDDDWDGYNAPKISNEVINISLETLDTLYKYDLLPDEITPTPRGCISFEWGVLDDTNYFYLEFDENEFGIYYTKDGKTKSEDVDMKTLILRLHYFFDFDTHKLL